MSGSRIADRDTPENEPGSREVPGLVAMPGVTGSTRENLTERPLLEVSALSISATFRGKSRTLVSDVSFVIRRGETLAIVGESGSGKTMTASSLVDLLPPGVTARGTALFEGSKVIGADPDLVRKIRGGRVALLMQDPFTALNPLQTAGDHVAESLPKAVRKGKAIDDEVIRRLNEVGITDPDARRRYPFQLSGGMRQRVAIACALAKDPDLLIADEPTTALDAPIQAEIIRLLRALQRDRRMSLLLITHNLRVAFAASDRVAVMYAGRVLETATSSALFEAPRHPYTLGLLLAEPPMDHARVALRGIPGRVAQPDDVAGRCAFADRCEWTAAACVAERPMLARVDNDHYTACIRIGEIAEQLSVRRTAADATRAPRDIPMAAPLLSVTSLRKTYSSTPMFGRPRSTEAVAGVDFAVNAAESVGLIGESGSGKTTVARCIVGLSRATSGSVHLEALDITDRRRLTREARRRLHRAIQYVFQDPYSSLNPAYSNEQTLREAISVGSQKSQEALQPSTLLELVGLPSSYLGRRPATMSGGERQRVAIARAIAVRPQLLICDEPVAALDVSVQAQILELLRDLQLRLKMSMLIISHDLAAVRQVTDRVLVMYQGRIVEEGATDQVISAPRHEYSARLVRLQSADR